MIDEIDQNITSKAYILDAVTWTSKAWDQVKTKTIVNCFSNFDFQFQFSVTVEVEVKAYVELDVEI